MRVANLKEFLANQPNARLAEAVLEVQEWRKKGVLTGETFHELAKESGHDDDYGILESVLLMHAAAMWAESVQNNSNTQGGQHGA